MSYEGKHLRQSLDLLIYFYNAYPQYKGSADICKILNISERQSQRKLKTLYDYGYLESLNSNPSSYRVNMELFNKRNNYEKD